MSDNALTAWLLEGDPAIRWQVMRDLQDAPEPEWQAERERTLETGWVAELLDQQGRDGEWPKGRWTASTWTLLLLVALGIPEQHPSARRPLEAVIRRFMPDGEEVDGAFMLKRVDLCHLGFWLGLGAHFLPDDPRLPALGAAVLSAQYDDGGWNCQMRNYPERRHSSFHTTFNVLEALRPAAARGLVDDAAFREAEARAIEFMLAHRLYRSDKTGAVASERFTELSYPWHWHYTFLRGLDYLRLTPAICDDRLDDPIELLRPKPSPGGWERRVSRCAPGTTAHPTEVVRPVRGDDLVGCLHCDPEDALDALEFDAVVRSWFSKDLLEYYLSLKRTEISLLDGADPKVACERYLRVY